jgi:hypothetical protein
MKNSGLETKKRNTIVGGRWVHYRRQDGTYGIHKLDVVAAIDNNSTPIEEEARAAAALMNETQEEMAALWLKAQP